MRGQCTAMKVIVLGGGVAGMSAAHELAERDIEVVVYETRAIPGGKARSIPVPASGKRGRRDLPARARLSLLPRLLPPSARHDEADPVRRPKGWGPGQSGCRPALSSLRSRDEPRSSRPHTFRPLSTISAKPLSPAGAGDHARDPRLRPGQFRQHAAPAADQLPRSAGSPSTSTRAGGSSRGRRRARPSTASSSPTA